MGLKPIRNGKENNRCFFCCTENCKEDGYFAKKIFHRLNGREGTNFPLRFIMKTRDTVANVNRKFEVDRLEKVIYLVRHCQAAGQAPEAELTREGEKQAIELADFFEGKGIIHIISSPFTRAVQSIEQTAKCLGLPVEEDARLVERVLSPQDLPDWMEHLEQSFTDLDMKLPGGESGREAAGRGLEVLYNAPSRSVLVTHGNLLALLLAHFNAGFGFSEWMELSNPDVYEIRLAEEGNTLTRMKR